MKKLIRYELRKQRLSFLLILAVLAACLIGFCFGLFLGKNNTMATFLILMFLCGTLSVFYAGVESVLVLNRDLRTKQSYMLWMTPHSVWKILGAKFLSAFALLLAAFLLYTAAFCFCMTCAVSASSGFAALADVALRLLSFLDMNWILLLELAVYAFLGWTLIVMNGFAAVLLVRTVLSRSRFAGLFALLLFFLLDAAIQHGYQLLEHYQDISLLPSSSFWNNAFFLAYYLIVCGLLFSLCGWVADKKLSV